MGMTIDDVILCLKGIKQYGSDTFIKRSQGDWQNSLDIAIDTMRKYQKIREIAFPLQFCTTDKLDHEAIMKICEVLEDGNDD